MFRQAFGEESMKCTWVFEWHARFRASWTSTEDDKHTRRPISYTTPDTEAKLQQLIHKDQRQTIQDFDDEIGICYAACQRILTAGLGMHGVAAKFVSRILTADHKQQHVNICEELCQIASDDCNLLVQSYHW
jgi:hypothetical protein